MCAAAAALLALLAAVAALASGPTARRSPPSVIVAGAFLVGISLGDRRVGARLSFAASRMVRCEPVRGGSCRRSVVSLREDATLTATGVSLTLDVRAIEPCDTSRITARPRTAVRDARRRPAVRAWHVGSESDGGVAGRPRVAGHRVASRARRYYRNPGCAGRAPRAGAARHRAGWLGQERGDGRRARRGSRPPSGRRRSGPGFGRCLSATVAPWSERSAGVAAAIAIGDRTGLAEDDEERLQAAGTYHVIAISGGNIAILTAAPARRRGVGWGRRRDSVLPSRLSCCWLMVKSPDPPLGRPRDRGGRPVSRRSPARTAWPSINILAVAANPGPVAVAHGGIRPWLSAVVWRDARHFDRSPETPESGTLRPNARQAERRARLPHSAWLAAARWPWWPRRRR